MNIEEKLNQMKYNLCKEVGLDPEDFIFEEDEETLELIKRNIEKDENLKKLLDKLATSVEPI